ncbi:SapC family protein [uncultured Gilvimarinus sp.]|uniref:SapC family protein n=1 Tax=uncultured Gilvimarinus sp. TaxID=1689143 RepID=UPI0030DC5A91
MEPRIEILDESTHRDLNVDFSEARASYFKRRLIPVVISEFFTLMFHYPIVFVKDGETGKFSCSVLLGVSDEATLLDDKSTEDDEALPLNIRRLPLLAIDHSPDSEPMIGINLDSAGINRGDQLFKHDSPELDSALAALSELYQGHRETDAYIKTALELGLVSKLQAEIQFNDKPKVTLEGLYSVDINKVERLIDGDQKDKFLTIARYAYAQNFSLYNMRKLTHLKS